MEKNEPEFSEFTICKFPPEKKKKNLKVKKKNLKRIRIEKEEVSKILLFFNFSKKS